MSLDTAEVLFDNIERSALTGGDCFGNVTGGSKRSQCGNV